MLAAFRFEKSGHRLRRLTAFQKGSAVELRINVNSLGAFFVGAIIVAVGGDNRIYSKPASATWFDGWNEPRLSNSDRGMCFVPLINQPVLVSCFQHTVLEESTSRLLEFARHCIHKSVGCSSAAYQGGVLRGSLTP